MTERFPDSGETRPQAPGDDRPACASPASGAGTDDERLLRSLGYGQELFRRMSGFSNFAISFSMICILAGGITSLQLGLSAVGGAAAGVAWPAGVGFCLLVALGMAQIASAFPTAGGLYHWSSILGGKGWGWAAAWFNLGGLIFVSAAVNVGTYQLFAICLGPALGLEASKLTLGHQAAGVLLITLSQAWLNHARLRVTTLLTDFSGYLIFAVASVLTVTMLYAGRHHDLGRLVTFANYSGIAGGGVWPQRSSLAVMFLLSLMWPIYTITGYDASAHTSEETVQAARNVPKGLLRSVYLSGLFGWVMVASFVLAMPRVADAARQGDQVFLWLMKQILPGTAGTVLWAGIVLANYLCGLACVTSTSRMTYAFARDGGLPFSGGLRKVSAKWKTPVAAIWLVAALIVASMLYAPVYSTLTTAGVIFLYISYVMPAAAGFFAYGKTWTRMGPFALSEGLFKTLAAISVAGVLLLIWIGVQPPNDKALAVTVIAVASLTAAWWLGVRAIFPGPPILSVAAQDPPPGARKGGPAPVEPEPQVS